MTLIFFPSPLKRVILPSKPYILQKSDSLLSYGGSGILLRVNGGSQDTLKPRVFLFYSDVKCLNTVPPFWRFFTYQY
jgi:hypothetical protein